MRKHKWFRKKSCCFKMLNRIPVKLITAFLVLNFGGLALGSWLMNNGPSSDWYTHLVKAPWTPPGWVFGTAWTTIMICFSIYLALLFNITNSVKFKVLYVVQLFFNIIWNYIFFNQQMIGLGLITILVLTSIIFYFFFKFRVTRLPKFQFLLVPYMLWLCIAISLNAYILFYN